ncbi:MAG: hypothetical protein E7048_05835 [Lentisphaerae bacterium]|nr:hypothetical protein [Lentisphaerota bacterium]
MKQLISVIAMLLMLAGISGCSTRYVNVRGERFEMISEKEEAALVEHARAALKTISKRIPPADMKIIDTSEPEKRFIYSDHRYGRAIIRWHFPAYEAGVDYEGEFLSEYMNSTVFTKKKKAETIDFTHRPVKRHRNGRSRR